MWAEACQVASASDLAAHVLGRHTVSRFVDFFSGHFEKGSEKNESCIFKLSLIWSYLVWVLAVGHSGPDFLTGTEWAQFQLIFSMLSIRKNNCQSHIVYWYSGCFVMCECLIWYLKLFVHVKHMGKLIHASLGLALHVHSRREKKPIPVQDLSAVQDVLDYKRIS